MPLILPLIRHLSLRGEREEAERYLETARRNIEEVHDPQKTRYRIRLAYVEALLLAREDRFAEAADHLQQVVEGFTANQVRLVSAQVAQVWGNVAQYRRMAGDLNNVIDAYKNAAALDPSWRTHMLQWVVEDTSRKGGDIASVIVTPDSSDPWLDAARFAMRQQLLLPPALRDWSQYRHALESARDESVTDEVICLEANHLAIIGQWEQAKALLTRAQEDHPTSPLILRTLALLHIKLGNTDLAIDLVDKIDLAEIHTESLVLLKSELLCATGRYDQAVELLHKSISETVNGDDENHELTFELARVLTRMGDWEQAKTVLRAAPTDGENALRTVEMLSRLAWCQQDWITLEECENRLRTIEGSDGALWRTCRIRRLLGQSSQRSDQTVSEAVTLAKELRTRHPDLQVSEVTSARVATYRGLLWEAIGHYEHAWSMGSPSITLAVDLIALLNELGQTERAQRYVNEARRYMRASEQMIDRSLVDLVNDTDEDAIRFAEAWVKTHPTGDGHLRYGRTLALAAIPGSKEEAERLELARKAF
ncbi:MAG: tetratricopeptide repeat protein, partial [Planctomycetaceae bacterium]|nr:tetratricopeptide repeat protein [Planctomycetaceae bacterium]